MNRAGSVRLEIAELRRCDERASTCPLRQIATDTGGDEGIRFRCIKVESRDFAVDRLRRCLAYPEDMRTLRRLVSDDNLTSFQLDDQQVLEQVAAMLMHGTLCLVSSAVPRSALLPLREELRPTGTIPRPVTGRSPSQLVPRPSAPAVPSAPPPDDLVGTVDPAKQAAVLADAARTGTPFCEVCEKARREEAQRARARSEAVREASESGDSAPP